MVIGTIVHCGESKTQRKWFLNEKRDGLADESRINNEQKEKQLQGQLLEGVECHIYLYCFTFDDINLNRAFVNIVLFPKHIAIRKCVQMVWESEMH